MRRSRLVVMVLLIAACGTAATEPGPPQINFGRDVCIECGMIIDDPRFAAAYLTTGGEWRTFDDLGGLLIHGRETGELATARQVWVSDFELEEWTTADDAHYVPTRGVASPMGYGVLAFGTLDRAAAFAAGIDGEVLGWDAVVELDVSAVDAHVHEG